MKSSTLSLNEVSLLTGSIEYVVRSLIKIIVGKISLRRLQELVQNVFVEEAENALRERRPDRDVPLTKLALLTGLDTRVLARIRNSREYRKPLRETKNFVSTITPVKCVTDLWRSDSRFTTRNTGRPRVLEIFGEGDSLETVVRESVKARGITINSIVENLLEQNEAELTKGNKIKLNENLPLHQDDRDRVSGLFAGLNAVGALLSTVHHNLTQTDDETPARYQRGSWTHRLPASRRQEFAEDLYNFLERSDDEAVRIMRKYEEKTKSEHQITAGINFFYFESPLDQMR